MDRDRLKAAKIGDFIITPYAIYKFDKWGQVDMKVTITTLKKGYSWATLLERVSYPTELVLEDIINSNNFDERYALDSNPQIEMMYVDEMPMFESEVVAGFEEGIGTLPASLEKIGSNTFSSMKGYLSIKKGSSHRFQGHFGSIFNTPDKARILNELYYTMINPVKNKFLLKYDLMTDGTIDIQKAKNMFKSFMNLKWSTDKMNSKGLQTEWNEFIDDIFDTYFSAGFTPDGAYTINRIRQIIENKLTDTIFDFIMRKFINIDAEMNLQLLNQYELPSVIQNYLLSPMNDLINDMSDIEKEFLHENDGKEAFLQTLSESFFADPLSNRMVSTFNPSTYHGAVLEALVFFNELPVKVAELFARYINEGSDYKNTLTTYSYADVVNNKEAAFRLADFNQKLLGDKVLSKKNLDLLMEKLFGFKIELDTPSKGRAPDLGVFDFMTLVLSNHLKNTWFKSGKTQNIREGITLDTLSAQLLDSYAEVWRPRIERHMHENDLYSPYTSQIFQRSSAKEIFNEIFSKKSLVDLLGKVNTKHVFIIKISELINKYVALAQVSNPITSTTELKIYIEQLFKNNVNFMFEIDLIIKYVWGDISKSSYIKSQGHAFYTDLLNVFINNIDKVAKETSDGFRVIFGVNIEYYFDKDTNGNTVYITRDLLPSNAKYIKELDTNKNAVLADLTSQKLNEMFSTPGAMLFIAHDKVGNFIIINSESINNLPENIIEGYRHNPTGEVFHNLILNRPGSRNLLFGRVKFTSSGQIEIQDADWYKDFLKSSNHLTKETRESYLRFIQSNGKKTDVDIYSLRYFTVFGYVTGSQFIATIQETKTNLIPTLPYAPYLPASESLRENKITKLKYNLPSKVDLEDKYGKEFVEKFYEIFQSLFLPGGQELSSESVVPLVHKFLATLNGRQVAIQRGEENINKFVPGPDIDQINLRINELFKTISGNFDKDSFLKFIWRNDNKEGTFRESQSQKMWIKNLFDKIMAYTTEPNQDLIRAQLELDLFSQKSGYASSFDMGNNKYTKQEAKLAGKVLELTNNLFGHFTVRLTFAKMVNYYSGADGIGIKIQARPSPQSMYRGKNVNQDSFLKQLMHVGFITSTNTRQDYYIRKYNTI
ncbi:hypothetical protein LCGC14_1605520, partial [marine sediment metagenome]